MNGDEEVDNQVTVDLRAQSEKFCDIGIGKSYLGQKNCFDKSDECVEKWLQICVKGFRTILLINIFEKCIVYLYLLSGSSTEMNNRMIV